MGLKDLYVFSKGDGDAAGVAGGAGGAGGVAGGADAAGDDSCVVGDSDTPTWVGFFVATSKDVLGTLLKISIFFLIKFFIVLWKLYIFSESASALFAWVIKLILVSILSNSSEEAFVILLIQ